MKPKYLYHGSGVLIKGNHLKLSRPSDDSRKHNYVYGVYATDKKDIAVGMSLTGDKYTRSFGDYHQKPFRVVFIRGQPKSKLVYVYKVLSKSFKEKPKNSHQWISLEPAKIITINKYKTINLKKY